MRLIVGCTLDEAEVEAIEKGESLKDLVAGRFTAMPLVPPDAGAAAALELLAWMVAQGILEIRVAVPCDSRRRPIPAEGIFQEKSGIVEDKTGGRIDRLGQQYPVIRIVNLHYAATVEADVYLALRERIGLFENVVGKLQPILARLGTTIGTCVLQGRTKPKEQRDALVSHVESDAAEANRSGFDLDEFTDADVEELPRAPAALTLDDLDRVIAAEELLPPGLEASPLGSREYRFQQPGLGREVRVTTNPTYYEENAETVELWSPGSPTFPEAGSEDEDVELEGNGGGSLSEILAAGKATRQTRS